MRKPRTREALGEIETLHPGYLGSQDTYYWDLFSDWVWNFCQDDWRALLLPVPWGWLFTSVWICAVFCIPFMMARMALSIVAVSLDEPRPLHLSWGLTRGYTLKLWIGWGVFQIIFAFFLLLGALLIALFIGLLLQISGVLELIKINLATMVANEHPLFFIGSVICLIGGSTLTYTMNAIMLSSYLTAAYRSLRSIQNVKI